MINTDLSIQHKWIGRKGFNNSFTVTFTNASVAFNIASYTFVLNIRRIGSTVNSIQLTEVSGLTNGGASGILTVQLTAANTNLIDADSYYYELVYTVGGLSYGLLHGSYDNILQYNNENENNDVSVDVNLAGTDVNVSISLVVPNPNTRVSTTTSTATLTPNVDNYDMFKITAQAEALVIANPTGTPSDGNVFLVDIEDNGTARAITYGNGYVGTFIALPSTTILGKRIIMAFMYNSTLSKYELLNVINEL